MRYKGIIEKIRREAADYKTFVMDQVSEHDMKQAQIDGECNKRKGQWTEEYIAEYRSKQGVFKPIIASRVKECRAEKTKAVNELLDKLEGNITDYFNSGVSAELANKITAFNAVGLELTKTEIDMMLATANTYAEKRLVAGYLQRQINEKQANGEVTDWAKDAIDSLKTIKLPDAAETMKAFNEFKNKTDFFFRAYVGDHGELDFATNTPQELAVSAFTYFTNDAPGKYLAELDKVAGLLPKGQDASPEEMALIDDILKYTPSTGIRNKLQSVSKDDPEMREIIENDSRYAFYLDNE